MKIVKIQICAACLFAVVLPVLAEEKNKGKTEEKPGYEAVEDTSIEESKRSYTIENGDTLGAVAGKRYGHAGYWRLISAYNDIDANRLKIGQVVQTPSLAFALKHNEVNKVIGKEVEAILAAREVFLKHEETLASLGKDAGETVKVSEEISKDLTDAAKKIETARIALFEKREGVTKSPSSMAGQLKTVSNLYGEIAAGKGPKFSYKLERVHIHFGNAVAYSILWARDGYK